MLEHGLQLLERDTDQSRRLAMISIDNAVELTIRTYLGLPKRVTGIGIGRRKLAEISESFPDMLDALEEHAGDKITGIGLGEIEWFHRLRNQLYHHGNGLTVERAKVDVYAELAKLLWVNLLGGPEDEAPETPGTTSDGGERNTLLLGRFVREYSRLDKAWTDLLRETSAGTDPTPRMRTMGARVLLREGVIDSTTAQSIDHLRMLRNQLFHGHSDEAEATLTTDVVDMTARTADLVEDLVRRERGNRGATSPTDSGLTGGTAEGADGA